MDVLTREHLSAATRHDITSHKTIYNALKSTVASLPDDTRADSPPLHFLNYAIRNLIHPELLYTEIPFLVDLLAQIDLFRERAHKYGKEVLIWNNHYTRTPSSTSSVLSDEEENLAKQIADEGLATELRDMMRRTALQYCSLDIYYLWSSDKSYLLPQRLKRYFPPEAKSNSASTSSSSAATPSAQGTNSAPSLFLAQMMRNDTELEECRLARGRNTQFFAEVSAWQDEQEENGLLQSDDGEQAYREAFRAAFPPPAKPGVLAVAVEDYISKVENMVFGLTDMFQDNPPRPADADDSMQIASSPARQESRVS